MRTVTSRLIDFTTAVALKAGMNLFREYVMIMVFFTLSNEGQLAFIKKLVSLRDGSLWYILFRSQGPCTIALFKEELCFG